MHPVLFTLGPFTLYSYGAMLVVAFLVSTALARRASRRFPPPFAAISPEQIVDGSCLMLLGGILGGRLFYVILQWPSFSQAPLEVLAIWNGGLVWYGGFLGGLAVGWFYVRSQRLPFLRVMDHFIPFLALGHAIGRVGCFLNGCCYGKPTQAWCGIVLPGETTAALPTQLFEAIGLFGLFLALRALQKPRFLKLPGRLFGLYLISYALLRGSIEFLRGDQTVFWAGLTLQQLISLPLFMVGCFFMFKPALSKTIRRLAR